MRIVCISPTYPTHLKYWRGTFVENFCRALSQAGADISVIVPDGYLNIYAEKLSLWLKFRKHRDAAVPWSYAPFFSPSRLTARYRLMARYYRYAQEKAVYKCLDGITPRPDCVYGHFIGNGLSAQPWCRDNNVPLVVVSGESSYNHFYANLAKGQFADAVNTLHHLFFVSQKNLDAYTEKFGLPECPHSLLPNAVDTSRFKPGLRNELRQKLGLPQDKKIIGFVGYFIERKGPLRVLQAIGQLDDVYGVFIGNGPQRPTGNRVLFAGNIENERIPEWLAACDAFVLPSQNEGRSNAIIEALACGLPVVVSDRSFNREFLTEDCAVFVDPDHSDSIASGLKSLFASEQQALKMGEAARKLAEKHSLHGRAQKFLARL